MKHAAVVVIAAGLAGATWFRTETPSRTAVTARLQIPDPGPAEIEPLDLFADLWPADPSGETEVVVPDDPGPTDLIALKPRIQTISEEQPFAVSETETEAESVPEATARTSPAKARQGTEFDSEINTAPVEKEAVAQWKSVDGRTITVRRLGTGRSRTVILTGLDGRDRRAVAWADDFAAALESRTDLLEQQEFVFIRAANPDGLAVRKQANSHGVVLNRNFPTKRYRLDAAGAAGAGPASEPETRAILQTLYDVRPQRVIHLSSTTGNSGAYHNASAGELAQALQSQYGIHAERLDLDLVPGSVEEFVDATWPCRVMRLNLHGVPEEETPRKIVPILLSAVTMREPTGPVTPVSTPVRVPSRWQTEPTSSPVPLKSERSASGRSRPVQRRGYEELPPPPQ